jgi:hypothetical protein
MADIVRASRTTESRAAMSPAVSRNIADSRIRFTLTAASSEPGVIDGTRLNAQRAVQA